MINKIIVQYRSFLGSIQDLWEAYAKLTLHAPFQE